MNEIDVKKCCYYNSDNEPYCCELYDNECEAQNCYYKQLQHLKAGNEELKEKLEKIKEICAEQKERIEFNDDIDYESFDYILQIIESEE